MLGIILSTIATGITDILKAVCSLIIFFIRMITILFRLLLSVLPVTGCLLMAVYLLQISVMIIGHDPVPSAFPFHPNFQPGIDIYALLKSWWLYTFSSYESTSLIYYVILFITAIVYIPVVGSVLLLSSVFGLIPVCLPFLAADACWYLVRMVFAQVSPFGQIEDRFFVLFPNAGNKHYEKKYHKWLRRNGDNFDRDLDDDYDDDYDDRGSDDYDDEEYDEYDDNDDYDGFYDVDEQDENEADEYEDDYEEEYDDRYIDDRDRRRGHRRFRDDDYEEARREKQGRKASKDGISSFDFFAGCNSKESAEKKYHALVKLYHPDNSDGDTAALQEIIRQYEKIKRDF